MEADTNRTMQMENAKNHAEAAYNAHMVVFALFILLWTLLGMWYIYLILTLPIVGHHVNSNNTTNAEAILHSMVQEAATQVSTDFKDQWLPAMKEAWGSSWLGKIFLTPKEQTDA